MVITITCPSCSSSFPVDPAKIPEGGVNARCSSCGDVFRVEKPAEPEPLPTLEDFAPTEPEVAAEASTAPEPVPPPMPEVAAAEPEPEPEAAEPLPGFDEPAFAEPVAEVEPVPPPMPEVTAPDPVPPPMPEIPAAPEPVAEAPAADPFAQPAPFEAAPAAPEPEPATPAVQGFTFGKRDPTDKAKRLARVLVSDMIMYNAERHQSALAAGTLVQDFEEEIDKSWKEFVEQVGAELANAEGRQFWTEALNDILAKGQEIF